MSKSNRTNKIILIIASIIIFLCLVVMGIYAFKLLKQGEKEEAQIQAKKVEVEPKKEEKSEEEILNEKVDKIVSSMTQEEKVAQLFFVTPEQLTNMNQVLQAGDKTKEALINRPVGGLIYFNQNIQDSDQLKALTTNVQSYSKIPLFTGIDEEGGSLVARIANSGLIDVPSVDDAITIGNSGDTQAALQAATTIGTYLKEYGFNVDFAPDSDVVTNEANSVIGIRSFGSDPNVVASMVSAQVEGFKSTGVASTLKHFPGHGSTYEDSHMQAAVVDKTKEELESCDFVPFKSGIESNADFIMVGHLNVPSITNNTPATLSPEIVTDILINELGFKGIIITDSMQMGAIVNYYDSNEACVMALQAGCDMLLMPNDFEGAYQAVLNAVNSGLLTSDRIDNSVSKIIKEKINLGLIQ